MRQFWLLVGSEKNWRVAFENKNLWGLKDFQQLRALWNMLREGDGLLFYVSKPVHGIVGFGQVASKFRQTTPLWPEEIAKNEVLWPLRFEFDIEYCLPPSLWKTRRYTSHDLQNITRMVFQCCPIEEVNLARSALALQPIGRAVPPAPPEPPDNGATLLPSHEDAKEYLAEIGRVQGYIADKEWALESTYLDVVWRRVERSVPTFAFEVQIGGDIYHAMAKLKHAFDLWNSRIFLVAGIQDRTKYEELISGTFHEVAEHMRFVDVRAVNELLHKKRDYLEMERSLGILRR
jgi:hypothetical protein